MTSSLQLINIAVALQSWVYALGLLVLSNMPASYGTQS